MSDKEYEQKCMIHGCDRIATNIIHGIDYNLLVCEVCYNGRKDEPEKLRMKRASWVKKPIEAHKVEKIIETYLDLASTIQNARGSVNLIQEYRKKNLSEFLEDICSTNNIRFKHNKENN